MLTAVVVDWSLAASVSGGGGKGKKRGKNRATQKDRGDCLPLTGRGGIPRKRLLLFFPSAISQREKSLGSGKTVVDDPRTWTLACPLLLIGCLDATSSSCPQSHRHARSDAIGRLWRVESTACTRGEWCWQREGMLHMVTYPMVSVGTNQNRPAVTSLALSETLKFGLKFCG